MLRPCKALDKLRMCSLCCPCYVFIHAMSSFAGVDANATDCQSRFDVIQAVHSRIALNRTEDSIRMKIDVPYTALGLVALCYKWNYLQQDYPVGHPLRASPTPFILFPNVIAAIVRFDRVSPHATAVGCASDLTIEGLGFNALTVWSQLQPAPPLLCRFGEVGATRAYVVNSTHIRCRSVVPVAVDQVLSLRVDLGNYTADITTAFPYFAAYNATPHQVTNLFPPGSGYPFEGQVQLHGSFANYGSPACRFGNTTGTAPATLVNNGLAKCYKPPFPDSFRDATGLYDVTFSANGQCFSESKAFASYYLYNSHVEGLRVLGAPIGSAYSIDIRGDGFVVPALAGGVCRFSRIINQSHPHPTSPPLIEKTVLIAISSTLIRCPSPASSTSAVWLMQVMQNGVDPIPTVSRKDLFFHQYRIDALKLKELVPPGAPIGVSSTIVTIKGEGFALYGNGQLVCRLWDADDGLPPSSHPGNLVDATLIDASRIMCTLPPPIKVNVSITYVSISLNGNEMEAALINNWLPFQHYMPARISYVSPMEGDAEGSTQVVVYGAGFTALSLDDSLRRSYIRVRLGLATTSVQVTSLSDSMLTCIAPSGANGTGPVQVALDSKSFSVAGHASESTFTFRGLHTPVLLSAHFDSAGASSLVISFDDQPTNRANMIGIGPCSAILDSATAAQLKGTASVDASCFWVDDTTLIAQLTIQTHAAPGMQVSIREGALWPKTWTYPGSCHYPGSKCMPGGKYAIVDADFPCDHPATKAIEFCQQPTASIVAPDEISSCQGTTVTLNGAYSIGGGVQPLTYRWSVPPRSCDNYVAISAFLAELPVTSESLTMYGAQLDGGAHFEVDLVVTNFLGIASAPLRKVIRRAALPIPHVVIDAPPRISIAALGKVRLSGKAEIAP